MLSFDEVKHEPHLRSRATLVEIDGVAQPAVAPRFSRTPGAAGRHQPAPGDDTIAILEESGYSAAEVDALIASGAALVRERQE